MKAILTKTSRRRGPIPQPGRVRVTLYLDEQLAEWGKQQDGGLSGLVRTLLRDAQVREDETTERYPPELKAIYHRLANKKLHEVLTSEEEKQLTDLKAQINSIDRSLPNWEQFEAMASTIDQKLAELRRDIEALPERTGVPNQ